MLNEWRRVPRAKGILQCKGDLYFIISLCLSVCKKIIKYINKIKIILIVLGTE